MKYHIEELLKDDKIECHEIRATTHNNTHVLLHFFITTSTLNKNSLPKFKMGYEHYKATAKEIEKANSKPEEDNILSYSFLNKSDNADILFSQFPTSKVEVQYKNEWTGENSQQVLNTSSTEQKIASSMSSENISTNKNLRYVSEMDDNSIYGSDDLITEKNYLETKDASLQARNKENALSVAATSGDLDAAQFYSNLNDTNTSTQKSHSVWRSKIHFDKFEQCSNEEMLHLFKHYQIYIEQHVPVNLDTESRMNIDMETIFGTSFDLLRIKNNLVNKNQKQYTDVD